MYKLVIKPVLDRLLALLGLIIAGPLFLIVALLVLISTRQSPIFRQRRIGYRGRPFWLYKFRSMTNARNEAGNLLPDSDRITPLGNWLRRTSVDELPQLLNVLRGEMSLIGPRPLPDTYAAMLTHHNRHSVRPGLTGWAQIHGRNHLSWKEKFALDSWYIAHCSVGLDGYILWRTWFVLLDTSPLANPLRPCYFTEPEATPESSSAS